MQTATAARFYLSAISPIGEHWNNLSYATAQERTTVVQNMRIAGWLRITLHDAPCTNLPADDHEHCPLHGCVEYVCCIPAA